jgi:hypothetical protein
MRKVRFYTFEEKLPETESGILVVNKVNLEAKFYRFILYWAYQDETGELYSDVELEAPKHLPKHIDSIVEIEDGEKGCWITAFQLLDANSGALVEDTFYGIYNGYYDQVWSYTDKF